MSLLEFLSGICYDCGMDVFKKTGECYLCRNVRQGGAKEDSRKEMKG